MIRTIPACPLTAVSTMARRARSHRAQARAYLSIAKYLGSTASDYFAKAVRHRRAAIICEDSIIMLARSIEADNVLDFEISTQPCPEGAITLRDLLSGR